MDNNRFNSQYEEKVVQINRVSKKTKGGNKVRFAALAVVGDKAGKVGVGLAKSADVSSAIAKAVLVAKKKMITVPLVKDSIAHEVRVKKGASQIILRPAPAGSGIIAGGAVRSVVEAAGIRNISSKILGSDNKAGNIYATFEALKQLSK